MEFIHYQRGALTYPWPSCGPGVHCDDHAMLELEAKGGCSMVKLDANVTVTWCEDFGQVCWLQWEARSLLQAPGPVITIRLNTDQSARHKHTTQCEHYMSLPIK